MTDIMQEWKNSRFIIAPSELVDDGAILIVLSDFRFWSEHSDELDAWCAEHNARTEGMTVVVFDEVTLTHFVLRWS